MTMNLAQARVADQVLTNFAQGWKQPRFVGGLLFPRVPVFMSGGKVIQFDKASFRRYSSRRAPGGDVAQIDFGYEGVPYALENHALDARVPVEYMRDASKGPGIDLGMRAVNVVMASLSLGLEYDQAGIANNPASYPSGSVVNLATSPNKQWDDVTTDPALDIERGIETVRANTGMPANVMIMGPKPYRYFKNHPRILERFRGISAESVTGARIAAMFDLEQVGIGYAVEAGNADSDPFSDVWGDNVIIGYAPQASLGQEEPSFGYTYAIAGQPYVTVPTWKSEKRSFVYGVNFERSAVLTGQNAGYLIQNAVSASAPPVQA